MLHLMLLLSLFCLPLLLFPTLPLTCFFAPYTEKIYTNFLMIYKVREHSLHLWGEVRSSISWDLLSMLLLLDSYKVRYNKYLGYFEWYSFKNIFRIYSLCKFKYKYACTIYIHNVPRICIPIHIIYIMTVIFCIFIITMFSQSDLTIRVT